VALPELDWLPVYPDRPARKRTPIDPSRAIFAPAFPVPALSWSPRYPIWFPPKQKAREGWYALAMASAPFTITQYVVEAWLPLEESTFANKADSTGCAWVEVTFDG